MNAFNKSLSDDGFSVTESESTSIPPSSLHSFLKLDPKFPGIILTGFKDQFKNKYVLFFFLLIYHYKFIFLIICILIITTVCSLCRCK